MAKVTSGILGIVKGKCSGVVFATWKGKNYARALVIPANPQSDLQMAQRGLMGAIVYFCKQILTTIIQPYWDPMSTTLSGWNLIVKKNLDSMSNDTDWANLKISDGSLEGATITSAVYNPATGGLSIEWDSSIKANGKATDQVLAIVYDTAHNFAYQNVDTATRSDISVDFTLPSALTASTLKVYLAFHPDGATVMSPTAYLQVTT